MRERYFGTYQSIVYKKCYYEEHQRRSEKCLFWTKAVCALVSILSVLVWSISKDMPALWACLIAVSQIAQSMLDYLPWSRQLRVLDFLLPELNRLIADLDEDWLKIEYDEAGVDKIMSQIAGYERRFFDLEAQYTTGIWFPVVKSVVKEADSASDAYFNIRYFLPKESDEFGKHQ